MGSVMTFDGAEMDESPMPSAGGVETACNCSNCRTRSSCELR